MKNMYATLLIVLISLSYAQAQTSSRGRNAFIFSAHGGSGYRIATTESGLSQGLKDHVNALRTGLAISVEGGFHFNPNNAITLSWGMFSSSNNSGIFNTSLENGISASTRVNTKDAINTIMANWLTYANLGGGDKARLFGQVGIGLATHCSRNEFFFEGVNNPANLKGTGFASNVGAGLDLKMSNNFFLTGQVNYLMARVRMKYEDGSAVMDNGEKENLNHIRLTAGIRYRF